MGGVCALFGPQCAACVLRAPVSMPSDRRTILPADDSTNELASALAHTTLAIPTTATATEETRAQASGDRSTASRRHVPAGLRRRRPSSEEPTLEQRRLASALRLQERAVAAGKATRSASRSASVELQPWPWARAARGRGIAKSQGQGRSAAIARSARIGRAAVAAALHQRGSAPPPDIGGLTALSSLSLQSPQGGEDSV